MRPRSNVYTPKWDDKHPHPFHVQVLPGIWILPIALFHHNFCVLNIPNNVQVQIYKLVSAVLWKPVRFSRMTKKPRKGDIREFKFEPFSGREWLPTPLEACSFGTSAVGFPTRCVRPPWFSVEKTWRRCQGLKSNSLSTKLYTFPTCECAERCASSYRMLKYPLFLYHCIF